jgi:hypothetical protein
MSSSTLCPLCGQVLPQVRCGAILGPIKSRVFDIVSRAGRDGINSDDLFTSVYNENVSVGKGIRQTRSRKTLHNHVHQINELIEGAGYRIVHSSGAYRLKRAGQ